MTERLSTHLSIESRVGFWIGVLWIFKTLWIFSLHSLRSWAATLAEVLAISLQGTTKAFPGSSGSLRPCCSWPLPPESLPHASWISALSQEACMNLIVLTEDRDPRKIWLSWDVRPWDFLSSPLPTFLLTFPFRIP